LDEDGFRRPKRGQQFARRCVANTWRKRQAQPRGDFIALDEIFRE